MGLGNEKMIGLGKQNNGLYYFHSKAKAGHHPTTCNTFAQPNLWHQRLGHPSMTLLRYLAGSIYDIYFSPNKHCDIYHLAKQTRLQFSSSSISTIEHFELIHCDIWDHKKFLCIQVHIIFLPLWMPLHVTLGYI